MSKVREFGIGFENLAARDQVKSARLAEELGYGTFWVPEDPFWRGAFTIASAAAAATSTIRVGIGVINPYTRSPSTIAMEFGALEEISGGRSILGIGAGIKEWIEDRLGITYVRPTAAMRETIEVVRRMFRGEQVNFDGRVFRNHKLALSFKPPRTEIPIHLGVMGPKNLEMAGESADGLLLSIMSSPAYIRFAIEHARKGLQKAGRDAAGFEIGGYVLCSMGDDDRAAREAIKPLIAMMTALMAPQPEHALFATAGLDPDVIRAMGASLARGEVPVSMVTDWMIDTFTIAGSPERCRENLAKMVDAGLTSPTLFDLAGMGPDRLLREVHKHLMPHFL